MDPAEILSGAIGAPPDQLRLVLCCIVSYPLGILHRNLATPFLRHVVGMVIGILFGIYCYGFKEMFHPVFVSAVCYGLSATMPRKAPKIVFPFAFGYLCIGHIYRMYTDYMGWTMDYTAAQMIVTLKVIQLAYNVADAGVPVEKLHKEEIEDRVEKLPPPLEYFSYIFFYPTFLVGPNFTFNMYNNFINRKETPNSLIPSLKKLGQSVFCYMFIIASGFMPVTYATTDAFRDLNIFSRIVYIWVSVVCYRFKYYFIWSLCEGACTACGLSYNGKAKEKPKTIMDKLSGDIDAEGNKWDLVKAVNIAGVELAQNVKSITDNWNMTVGRFLAVYVYKRMSRPPKRPGQLNVYVTQFVSACWHGFYPGYYMFFVSTSGVVSVARTARTLLRPIFAEKHKQLKPLYDILSFISTVLVLNVLGAAFIVLDFYAGFKLWRNVWFFSHVMTWLGMAALHFLKPTLRKLGPAKPAASPSGSPSSPQHSPSEVAK